jgi:hypothetical protein
MFTAAAAAQFPPARIGDPPAPADAAGAARPRHDRHPDRRDVDRLGGGPRDAPPAWFVETQSTDVDTFDAIVADLEAVLSTIASFTEPMVGPLAIGAWYQAHKVDTAISQPTQGVGVALAAAAMPLSIAIPGGSKIPVQYSLRPDHHDGVQVDATGMYVGGLLLAPVPPTAGGHGGRRHEGAHPADRRPGRHDDGPSLTLTFGKSTGPFTPQSVAVTVTDADGLTAHASTVVTASLQQSQGHDKGSRNRIRTA